MEALEGGDACLPSEAKPWLRVGRRLRGSCHDSPQAKNQPFGACSCLAIRPSLSDTARRTGFGMAYSRLEDNRSAALARFRLLGFGAFEQVELDEARHLVEMAVAAALSRQMLAPPRISFQKNALYSCEAHCTSVSTARNWKSKIAVT
jgi:hypothetical protein